MTFISWIFFFRPYFHYCLSSAHYCEDHFHSRLYPQFKYMTLIYSSPFKLNIGVYDFPHKLISLVNPYIYFTVLRDDCVVSFKHNPLLLVTLRAVLETREIRLALVFRYNLKGFFAGQFNSPNNKHSNKFIWSTLYREVFFI